LCTLREAEARDADEFCEPYAHGMDVFSRP
jgi:hypothetical protein